MSKKGNYPKSREEREKDPWMMYLVVNTSLGMSPGKVAAQVGHAVGMMYEEYASLVLKLGNVNKNVNWEGFYKFNSWKKDHHSKVVLAANEEEWKQLLEEEKCFVVRDAGFTEIASGSETVIGLWPRQKSKCSDLLRSLKLLKG